MMAQVGMKYAAKSAPVNELIRQFVDMSLPAIVRCALIGPLLCGEVTRLNCGRQCKPFVYLNPDAFPPTPREKSVFRGDLPRWNPPQKQSVQALRMISGAVAAPNSPC